MCGYLLVSGAYGVVPRENRQPQDALQNTEHEEVGTAAVSWMRITFFWPMC